MISEAIILAGGLGTRLRSEVSEYPKSMAPINGIPFLKYQLNHLAKFEFKTVIIAAGYLSDIIIDYFGDSYLEMNLIYSIEKEPLGTGGAIIQALEKTKTEEILILNGDTMFQIELNEFYKSHKETNADFSMALKPLTDFERYGVVTLNDNNRVIGFEEKQYQKQGVINGGVYILNKSSLDSYSFPNKFSFEKEFLELKYTELNFNGFKSDDYFLDIGIPSDFIKAQKDFRKFEDWKIDKTWTLFLDRDGVINTHINNGYVTKIDEFKFIEGVLESIPELNNLFGKVVVVTNQQCIGKEIINEEQLNSIHNFMDSEIENKGGKIDKIYFAPQLAIENSEMRKPKTGMALQAKKDFTEIDFNKSIIVGDSLTDMEFGKELGMKTVFINSGLNGEFDKCFPSLKDFSKSL
ncbi:HAD-IIIA family hydrolase [Flavobacteriales bacterium]|nr:HAD-IIIA family hydrolase [Flavobacteriales bacterium]